MTTRFAPAQRKRVLKALPRPFLEDLSGMESAWNADRPTLEAKIIAGWDEETKAEIINYLDKHL